MAGRAGPERRITMPETVPFHSSSPLAPRVFHNNVACVDSQQIDPRHWRVGDAGRPLCSVCARLNVKAR